MHFQWIATLGAYLRACFGWFEKDAPILGPSGLLMRMDALREMWILAPTHINDRVLVNAPPATLDKCVQM